MARRTGSSNSAPKVHGFSLAAAHSPSLFDQLGLAAGCTTKSATFAMSAQSKAVAAAQPDFVLHLAAQPLVRLSYVQPVETYATNVLGTVHLLEALRG